MKPVTRGGAKAGDKIFVTGALGGSILGRHMDFVPRVEMGREIAPRASAMIDISDGLLRDLGNICRASDVGAIVESARVPIHLDAVELAKRDGVSAVEHALRDGEDYELLYCCAEEIGVGSCVGRIVSEAGIFLEDERGRGGRRKCGGGTRRLVRARLVDSRGACGCAKAFLGGDWRLAAPRLSVKAHTADRTGRRVCRGRRGGRESRR